MDFDARSRCGPALRQGLQMVAVPRERLQLWCFSANNEQTVRDASKEDQMNQGFLARPFKAISAKIATRWIVIAFCLVVWLAVVFLYLL
ncbi:hypothetical protein JF546_03935 [Nitratireductor aquimarinus]|uniref:Uncharacterized protein n=1 Tax=Nitratireductor aquimarinus TaxID=889300 RepID=A0ABU4ANF1_9HYPH|nr:MULTISPECIES: hypothetical protein [Alphaproteobacteria]MBY6020536.1 hypothetical protein [Nitratireductor sp. DP7N14-4]MBN7755750.1 hypothetical protein [Nitratireductor aquimarinus]MBN7762714.1 hypothetical protein [Nitratireductor aquibiodomus]MBN7777490.1 hypothetical protein [Nitratireductor pacificus]MBN7781483.1 hypothetical protein [Nitratireductor pacificus]